VACWPTIGTSSPAVLTPPSGAFDLVACGDYDACGLRADGTVSCWGSDSAGALGAPTGAFDAIGSGKYYSCAIGAANNSCWGGALGAPPIDRLRALAVAGNWGCGIRDDGSLVSWGQAPAASPPAGVFRALSAATGHACAVRDDGTLACWGDLNSARTPPAGLVAR
jgi:alpha-tubulin suppressor-like RCC1 family protein